MSALYKQLLVAFAHDGSYISGVIGGTPSLGCSLF